MGKHQHSIQPDCMGQCVVAILQHIVSQHGAMGNGVPWVRRLTAWGNKQWGFYWTLSHYMGQWAMGII